MAVSFEEKKDDKVHDNAVPTTFDANFDEGSVLHDKTQRKLQPFLLQMLAIGGTIGTYLFVGIGKVLLQAGPANLLIAVCFWSTVILAATVCLNEMVSYLPISSPFIAFAGRFVDDAFGMATGVNFFLLEAFLVPFEVTACNIIVKFWTEKVPVAAIVTMQLLFYVIVNIFGVNYFGQAEFYFSIGKILLIAGLTMYTLVTMCGGNPLHHAYGFENWGKPRPFLEYYATGHAGQFLAFLQALIGCTTMMSGPEFISMAAGEVVNPRKVIPKAFKTVFWRLGLFFVVGVLCIGIVCPSNSAELAAAYANNGSNASTSPYVISMRAFNIPVLPHIVNFLLLTSCISAGNGYFYCATRSLYGMALTGRAPRFFVRTTRSGVPLYAVAGVLCIGLLSYMQVSKGSAVVLTWLVSLETSGLLINFAACCVTYVCFRRAYLAQGIPDEAFPYKSWGQPYVAYYGVFWFTLMSFVIGYAVFLKGGWNTPSFFFSYTMIGVFVVVFVGWKLIKRTQFVDPSTADLRSGMDEIEAHEAGLVESESWTTQLRRRLPKLPGRS